MVEDLYRLQQRDFTVLAGRHGGVAGSEFPGRKEGDNAVDPKGDRDTRDRLKAKFSDISIDVVDIEKVAGNTILEIQSEIKQHLSRNKVVILAWCFSFHSMKAGIAGAEDSAQLATANTKLSASFANDWKYLETFTQLGPVKALEAKAEKIDR